MSYKLLLPVSVIHKGTRFQLARMLPRHIPEVEVIVEQTIRAGYGVGVDERIATQDLTQEGKRGHLSVCLLDEASGSVAAVGSIFPSLLARSTRPATAGLNPRIKQDFQDQGLIAKFLPECIKVMAQLGYIGLSSRTLLKVAQRMRPGEQHFTGIIPQSLLVAGKGRLDDVTLYTPFPAALLNKHNNSKEVLSDRSDAPSLDGPLVPFPEHLLDATDVEPVILSSSLEQGVTLRSATLEDLPEVEALIRHAAIHGEGFALDEFQDGFFNRKFLRASHTLVAVQPIVTSSLGDSDNRNERVLGAALFGPSALCRSVSTPTMGGYLVVHPGFRRQGIGKSLLCAVEDFARSRGFTSLMSDVFVDNTAGHLMTRKSGFICTGSIHQCATTANSGLIKIPDSKVDVAHMGPTWILSAPGGPHVGSMSLAIRDRIRQGTMYGDCKRS